jgi:hypothetical protein
MFIVFTSLVFVSYQCAPTGSIEALSKRASEGDVSAVLEIGKSGDPQAIKILLFLMNDRDYRSKREVRLALAKAGDHGSLQYFACRSLSHRVRQIDGFIKKDLDYIGGDFTIQIYRQLLDSDDRFLSDMNRIHADSDSFLTFPGSTAVTMLSELLPNTGIPKPTPLAVQAGTDRDIRSRWAAWIDTHEDEIRRLMPTTDGINFESTYCSDYGISSAMDRRLRTLSGSAATNCGRVETGASPSNADRCVKINFASKAPFFVRYDIGTIDEEVAAGLAFDGVAMYAVAFDDLGVNTSGLREKAEPIDEGTGLVVSCPKPISLKSSVSKGLTCISHRGHPLLSPQ